MRITSGSTVTALLSATALLAMSGSPALAAEPIARAQGTGLVVTLASGNNTSGTYAVSNDGTRESSVGSNKPALGLLGNQDFLSVGTLAQDARTTVTEGRGSSAACSGVAGRGASVAGVGDGSCLSGGDALSLTPGALDLTRIADVQLVQGTTFSSLDGLLTQLTGQPGNPADTLLASLQSGLDTALAPLAGSGLVIGAGAIQSSCTADTTSARGTASIADAGAYVALPAFAGRPAQRIDLAAFPADPAPNTHVLVDLDDVTKAVIDGLQTSLDASAASALGQVPGLGTLLTTLGTGLQTVQTQLVANVVSQLQPALQPLNQNVLDATLNKQSSSGADQITVTALDLTVLPAAQQFGTTVLSARIATSDCGPSGRAAAPAVATAAPAPKSPRSAKATQVPTSVPAGLASAPSPQAPLGPWALAGIGGLLALALGAGTAAYRRSAARI